MLQGLKIVIFIAFIFFIFSAAIGQITTDTSIVGTWMGTLEAGGAKLRLVFHIFTNEAGILSGTMDSPDKGIIGIRLSNVYADNDSFAVAISAANAGYAGKFSYKKTVIDGIWKESGINFPITLNRTTNITKSRLLQDHSKENTVTLEFQKKSRHFEIYSKEEDRKVLDDLLRTLENSCNRITNHLQTHFTSRIKVKIYPDVKSFHEALYLNKAPDWVVGAFAFNELKMVSPLNPGSAHTYESLMKAIVHELVHAAIVNVRGSQGLTGLPKWLNEGYAFYEAHQMNDDMRKKVKSDLLEKAPPTWTQLDTAGIVQFGDMDGYALSTTIIEFLVDTYGSDKVRKLIKEPEKMNIIYGASNEELEKQWIRYLKIYDNGRK
jgi:hypothetical protein